MRHSLSFLVFLFSLHVSAQSIGTLQGKILDKTSQQPLANAYVNIQNKSLGTLANEHGEFTLKYPVINLEDNVVVSAIGYQNATKKIASFTTGQADTLWLEALAPIQLDTAFTNHVSSKKMVADAVFRVKANYQMQPFMLTGFYQETLWRDSLFVKISEALLKAEKNPTPPEKIPDNFMSEKVKLIKGRTYDKTDLTAELTEFGFGNGPAIVSHSMEVAIPEYLEGKNFDDYEYKLDSLLTGFDGKPAFIFHFAPANKKVKAAREGQIYVDTTSRAIIRIEYEFTPEGLKDVVKGTFKSVFGRMKTEVKRVSAHYDYRPFGGKWYLQDSQLLLEANLKQGKDFQAFASLHLAFVVNEVALKYNPAIRPEEHLQSTENFSKGGYRYDDTFWGNFNFLKPTPTMRAIVKKPVPPKRTQ